MTSPTTDPHAVDALKRQHHDTWADGDYGAVAEHIAVALPAAALDAVDVAGRDLLDVATGTGNLAILAAEAGASVTGLDLVDDLLDVARDRAQARGVTINWVEGDAEALPFPDASFDVVTSLVGVQFAPRSRVVADELLRVCRPGATIVLVNWTPDGLIGQLFKTMGRYMPAPAAWVTPPPRWGDTAHLHELFDDAGEVRTSLGTNPFDFDSVEAFMDFFERNYGPIKRARERLIEAGTWDALREDLRTLYAGLNTATDGRLHLDSEFVVCTVRRAG